MARLCVLALALTLSVQALPNPVVPARRVAGHLANTLPANRRVTGKLAVKAPGKLVAKRRVLPPLAVECEAVPQNPPFRVVNCKFVSRLAVPVCVKFACSPPPGDHCPAMGGTGAVQNRACSWAVTANCSIPTPVYPTRGNTYGFGWMTTDPAPVQVSIASFERVGFRGISCPE